MTWQRTGGRPTGPITPALIREEVLFTQTRILAGYSQTEVDDFLDDVANHLETLIRGAVSLTRLLVAESQRRRELEQQVDALTTELANIHARGGEEDATTDHDLRPVAGRATASPTSDSD